MDETGSYGQFCPVAMAAELICTRWTALVLRELLCGSTRFNDIRRGLPRMSPTLLSKRLKELEQAGVVEVRRGLGRRLRLSFDRGRRGSSAGGDVARHLGASGGWRPA